MDQTFQLATVKSFGVLSREARHKIFGIDAVDALTWRQWSPGIEYTKSLILKNVSNKQIKVLYKSPTSKAFAVDFPEPIKLHPGMSHAIKVVFRPIKATQYSDQIEVVTGDGSFMVPVQAVIPTGYLEVTPSVDFGFVPVREAATSALTVRNTSDVSISFSWRLEPPFAVSPSAGSLAPGETLTCDVSFTPGEACAYTCTAVCQPDSGGGSSAKLTGVGKFPYLSLEHSTLDFGPVLVGQSSERLVRFGNHSNVPANFTLSPADGSPGELGPSPFRLTPSSGTLAPDEYSVLHVSYTPRSAGTSSSETFVLSTPGGNKLALTVCGEAAGPKLSLSTRSINFGGMHVGASSTRVLYMTNHSAVPLVYEYDVDDHDVFAISKPRGTIPPATTTHVTVTCRPSAAANFWRRLACVVRDAEPVGLDLIVTAFDDKSRPPPLTQRHVNHYMVTLAEATGGELPDWVDGSTTVMTGRSSPELGASLTDAGTSMLTGAAAAMAAGGGGCPSPGEVAVEAANAGPTQEMLGPDGWALVFGGQDPARVLCLDTSVLDFGTCSRLTASEYRSVVVTNRSGSKLTAFLTAPQWADPVTGELQPVFHVLPPQQEIRGRGGSATFRVAFRPPRDGQFYSCRLHLAAFLKPMRNFRLLADSQVVPPFVVPLLAQGSTFLTTNPEFSPKVEIRGGGGVTFPPCRPGQKVHQTLLIQNMGDTAVQFAFECAALPSVFAMSPSAGLVPPKTHQLVCFRFAPTDARPHSARLQCVFNNSRVDSQEVVLRGQAHLLRLAFDTGSSSSSSAAAAVPSSSSSSTFFFRPTCVGATSQRSLTLRNPTRVPVSYRFLLPPKLDGVVSLSPLYGTLRGNESVQLLWTFAPAKQKTYEARVVCLVHSPDEPLPDELLHPDGSGTAAAAAGRASWDDASTISLGATTSLLGWQQQQQQRGRGQQQLPERMVLHVMGEGTAAAVSLDPPHVDLGVIPVGYPQKHSLTLTNHSDGVLRYQLECVVIGEDDPEAPPNELPLDFRMPSRVGADDVGPLALTPPLHHDGQQPAPVELWVEEPEGSVAAKASRTLSLTLFPRHRRRYKLQVQARTYTVMPPLVAQHRVPALNLLAGGGSASGASSPAATGRLAPLPSKPSFASDATAASSNRAAALLAAAPPVIAHLAASATFPTVLVTNVFCEMQPKSTLWQMLEVPRLNAALLSPVTPLELEACHMEDRGALGVYNGRSMVDTFNLFFGNHQVGSRRQSVYVELTNTTGLPLRWELVSYDSPDMEVENWVVPARPSNEDEQHRDFILEHRIIQWAPAGGRLEPGSKALLALSFNPAVEGDYCMPIFLHVVDGKRLCLQLRGSASLPGVQVLNLTHTTTTFTLHPLPIGEAAPPLQTYVLRNGGPGNLSYDVDLADVDALNASQGGYPVLACVSPTCGVIPPGGVVGLNWVFNPLEARVYEVRVPVRLGDGTCQLLSLLGRGYAPEAPHLPPPLPAEGDREWATFVGFNATPCTSLPGRLAVVSHDALSLGITLTRGVSRRLLLLTNTSRWPLAFDWDLGLLGGPALDGQLSLSPSAGSLAPGESLVCRVSYAAGLRSQVFEGDLSLNIEVDEAAVEELGRQAAEAQEEAAAMMGGVGESGSVVEEILDVQPPLSARARAMAAAKASPGGGGTLDGTGRGSRVRERLPLHMSMTRAAMARSDALNAQFTDTITKLTTRQMASHLSPAIPPPQTIIVSVSGRCLSVEQVQARTCVPRHLEDEAQRALAGAAWVTGALQPFYAPLAGVPLDDVLAAVAPPSAAEGQQQGQGWHVVAAAALDAIVEESEPTAAAADAQPEAGAAEPQASANEEPGSTPAAEADSAGAVQASAQQQPAETSAAPASGNDAAAPAAVADAPVDPHASFRAAPADAQLLQPLPLLPATAKELALDAAAAVLQALLRDVVADPYVGAALQSLEPEQLPAFAEVRDMPLPAPFSRPAHPPPPPSAPPKELVHQAPYQQFAEYVLESALFGLLQESAAGDWRHVPTDSTAKQQLAKNSKPRKY